MKIRVNKHDHEGQVKINVIASVDYVYVNHELVRILTIYVKDKVNCAQIRFEKWLEEQVKTHGEFFYIHTIHKPDAETERKVNKYLKNWYQ
jgi:hypothetical protein